jgi:integrase
MSFPTETALFQTKYTCINTAQSEILNFAWSMKKNGRAETTIIPRIRMLKNIGKLCNITNPEEVKTTLSQIKWKNISKKQFVSTYNEFLKTLNPKVTWEKPRYKPEEKLPFIPTETEIDQLIASCGERTATLLQTLKETGIRIGEAIMLKWINLSTQQKTLNITPEKGSNPRILPISNKLIDMLNRLTRRTEHIFNQDTDSLRTTFTNQRNETAKKLSNERLKQISFHTFRHFKGTMEYHKTKDIIHVKYVLGHKKIESTMTYINIEQATFLTDTDEWTCKTAKTLEEAIQLIEAGFQLIDTMEGIKIYKKRK